MDQRATRATHVILLLAVAFMCWTTARIDPLSADLLALWLAGQSMADGLPHLVYPAERIFTIRPPEPWIAMADAVGHEKHIFPYIYPPLTAAIMAEVTQAIPFSAFERAALSVNVALGLLTSWLAWRATGRVLALPIFLFVGALLFHLTIIGSVALDQGQPQVLVAFLTVLAVERLRARAQISAGIILAIAAAIKVYPLLFVVFLVARKQWRATGAFALTGGTLGLLSVALAGWPLHAAFLQQLSAISKTAVVLPLTFSFDSLFGLLHGPDVLVSHATVPSYEGQKGLIGAVEKGTLWITGNKLALLAALAGFAVAFARRDRVLLWPGAMIVLALLSPLAWSHHFLGAVAFAPALLVRWHPAVVLAIFAPLSIPALTFPGIGLAMVHNLTPIGTASMVALAVLMILHPRDLRRLAASCGAAAVPAR